MSDLFLVVEGIGELFFKKALVSYDLPVIFVCEDKFDSLYLFEEIEDNDKYEEWQAIKITRQTYLDLLSSKKSIQSVFRMKHSTPFLLITHHYDDSDSVDLKTSFIIQHPEVTYQDTFYSDFFADNDELDLGTKQDCSYIEYELYPGEAVDDISLNIHNDISNETQKILKIFGDNAKCLDISLGLPQAGSYIIKLIITSKASSLISAAYATKQITDFISSLDTKKNICTDNEEILKSVRKIYEAAEKTKRSFQISCVDEISDNKIRNIITIPDIKKKLLFISNKIKEIEQTKVQEINKLEIYGALVAFDTKNGRFEMKYRKGKSNCFIKGIIKDELKSKKYIVGAGTSYKANIETVDKDNILLDLTEEPSLIN
ncbi:hypothetical protein [uncultured Bacteroides sp.]|uniref:hypothetical protein n=1 Tax=uncultured Bacteroides sp. TaxID=162156 RepID=UPI002627583C|nr:hypothetical protein [uncultured Bacteroides sp.]